jgi:lipopolysaccharide/colanic/teichoic acid biosynthesis glycosyltransferase
MMKGIFRGMVRPKQIQYTLTVLDVVGALTAPFLAVVLRDWIDYRDPQIGSSFLPYALSSATICLVVLRCLGVSNATWHYFSICDANNVLRAGAVGVACGALVGFTYDRLESVARSVPLLQLFVQTSWLVGSRRLAQRFLCGEAKLQGSPNFALVIGCNATAITYMRAVDSLSGGKLAVAGLLAEDRSLVGATLLGRKIIGTVANVEVAISTMKMHGINVSRLVLASAPENLPQVELANVVRVGERLRLPIIEIHSLFREVICHEPNQFTDIPKIDVLGYYWPLKRLVDATAAGLLIILLSPLSIVTSAAVLLDIGRPLIFWQKRLGQRGRPFNVYKFRTMRPLFDTQGCAMADAARISTVGRVLRKTRLDELPQLANILLGEMSFVGPRPLLSVDQPHEIAKRLSVRPGLTGWAQVSGGKLVNPEEKRALDLWYVAHATLWLDIRIALMTLRMLLVGDVRNDREIARATSWLDGQDSMVDASEAGGSVGSD